MIIIIDGYNLLRAMFPRIKGRLTQQREHLVKALGIYRHKKSHDITIVFDAGPFCHAIREVHDGVSVVFSGQGRSADDYIVEYVKKNREKEKLLISNDRELKNRCDRYNIDYMGVADFEDLLENTLMDEVERDLSGNDDTAKYDRDGINNEALDILMEQSPVNFEKEDDRPVDRRSKSRKKSKAEKRLEQKIGKL